MPKKNADQFWARYRKLASKDLPVVAKTDIPQSTLSTWRNKSIFPRADEACKIADALQTTVEYLVSGKTAAAADLSPAALEIAALADRLNKDGLKIIKDILVSFASTYPKKK